MIALERSLSLNGQRMYVDAPGAEVIERFACFGGDCVVLVSGRGPWGTAREAALRAKAMMLAWHSQFSRFDADSELTRLNEDRRTTVPVSRLMARLIEGAVEAARMTGGLVDPTLLSAIERTGYRNHFAGTPLPLRDALALAGTRAAAGPSAASRWRDIRVDPIAGTVTRPPGVRLDAGGVAKGLFGDVLAGELSGHDAFAVVAAGDVRFGGTSGRLRKIDVADPFASGVIHVFELADGAAATSGIDRRSWIGPDGRPAHHLLDPATGKPAFTGIVQATALAPTALEAELRSKAALLSGPAGARFWLAQGGAVVHDDGTLDVVEPAGTHAAQAAS
jgi:thiamine biosynthesis lipoprotein